MAATEHLARRIVELADGDGRLTVFVEGMPPLRPDTARLVDGDCLELTVGTDTALVAVDRLVGLSLAGMAAGGVGFDLGGGT